MKQVVFIFILALMSTLAYGQLKVASDGKVGVGTSTPDRGLEVVGQMLITNGDTYPVAKQATMLMRHYSDPAVHFAFFKSQSSSTQNLVNFGGGAGANYAATSVVFFSTPGTTDLNGTERMRIRGDGRLRISSTGGSTTHDLTLHGTASKTGGGVWATISDLRLKTGVKNYDGGLKEIMQMRPVFFSYKDGIDAMNKEYVGVIAQEMQKIAPYTVEEVDVTFEEGEKRTIEYDKILTYDGTAVTYMLVNAVKEQQEQIEERDAQLDDLQAQIDELREMMVNLKGNTTNTETDVLLEGSDVAYLKQNEPNPFLESTVIKYYVPENTTGAHLNIFSIEGQLLKTIKLTDTGHGQVNVTANAIPAGDYKYQLVADGKIVANKTMVIVR